MNKIEGFQDLKTQIQWINENIGVTNEQVPDWVIEIVRDSSPDDISEDFSQFGIAAFLLSKYNSLNYKELEKDSVKDECSLYIFKLFFLFATELLRREEVLDYKSFNFFNVNELEEQEVVIKKSFDSKIETRITKRIPYNDFIGAFWNENEE